MEWCEQFGIDFFLGINRVYQIVDFLYCVRFNSIWKFDFKDVQMNNLYEESRKIFIKCFYLEKNFKFVFNLSYWILLVLFYYQDSDIISYLNNKVIKMFNGYFVV